MSVRFRPFGAVGSALEIVGGLLLLRSILWADENYVGWIPVAVVTVGALLVCAGVVGIVVAAWVALMARRSPA